MSLGLIFMICEKSEGIVTTVSTVLGSCAFSPGLHVTHFRLGIGLEVLVVICLSDFDLHSNIFEEH